MTVRNDRLINLSTLLGTLLVFLMTSTSVYAAEYRVELKAWIPSSYLVDPQEDTGVDDCDEEHGYGTYRSCESKFGGDGHSNYEGSYRVVSRVDFDWDGANMSNLSHSDAYGLTKRYHKLNKWWGGADYDYHSRRASSSTTGHIVAGTTNIVELSMNSKNPMMPESVTPAIHSEAQVFFYSDGTIYAEAWTDNFPNHGIGIYKKNSSGDWVLIDSCKLYDASHIDEWNPLAVFQALTTNGWRSCSGMSWGSPDDGGGGGGGGGGRVLLDDGWY